MRFNTAYVRFCLVLLKGDEHDDTLLKLGFTNLGKNLSNVIAIAVPPLLLNPGSVTLQLRRLPLQVCDLRARKPRSQQTRERYAHDEEGASNRCSANQHWHLWCPYRVQTRKPVVDGRSNPKQGRGGNLDVLRG
jgi:hypothetical protein